MTPAVTFETLTTLSTYVGAHVIVLVNVKHIPSHTRHINHIDLLLKTVDIGGISVESTAVEAFFTASVGQSLDRRRVANPAAKAGVPRIQNDHLQLPVEDAIIVEVSMPMSIPAEPEVL